jgi:putative transposase
MNFSHIPLSDTISSSMRRPTFQSKLYNHKHNQHLDEQRRIACFIYNKPIALHRRYYHLFNRHLPIYQLQKHLTKLKNTSRYSFWKKPGSQAIREITERIEKAYQRFFLSLMARRA